MKRLFFTVPFLFLFLVGCGMTTTIIETPAFKGDTGTVCRKDKDKSAVDAKEFSCWQQRRVKSQRNALTEIETPDGWKMKIDNRGKESVVEGVLKMWTIKEIQNKD